MNATRPFDQSSNKGRELSQIEGTSIAAPVKRKNGYWNTKGIDDMHETLTELNLKKVCGTMKANEMQLGEATNISTEYWNL